MSGALTKKLDLEVASEKVDGGESLQAAARIGTSRPVHQRRHLQGVAASALTMLANGSFVSVSDLGF
jgi:hypothetical protein